jgi:hypothetical protein
LGADAERRGQAIGDEMRSEITREAVCVCETLRETGDPWSGFIDLERNAASADLACGDKARETCAHDRHRER